MRNWSIERERWQHLILIYSSGVLYKHFFRLVVENIFWIHDYSSTWFLMAQHKPELCGAMRSNELLITNVILFS